MKALRTIPAGVSEALELAEGIDHALLHGFARLGEGQRGRLEALAVAFDGSPLGPIVAEAIEAVGRGEFVTRSFASLASARVALMGAGHDALVAQAREALGRDAVASDVLVPAPPDLASALLISVQQWLSEVARSGLRHLDEDSIGPFFATLESLQAVPELTGLAALLTGFANELTRYVPAARRPDLPSFRWGDIWSAAMVRTQQTPGSSTFREACGVLTPLGLDVQSHENFVCASLYGVLDEGHVQTVRIPFSSYKVDAINGPEIWDLFEPIQSPVLEALAGHKTLRVRGELRSDGDLVLRSPPEVASAADPLATADRMTSLPVPSPLLRHPVHIAEPVKLAAGHGLPMARERLGASFELTEEVLDKAAELVGLLRFDRGGWRFQPLCAGSGKKYVLSGQGLAGARKKLKNRSLEVLKERSGRLLRKG